MNGKPLPKSLSARDEKSFAYPTMKDRVPVIICKVVDLLYRSRNELNLKNPDEMKAVIESMSKLRYEIQTNKPMAAIDDDTLWNSYMDRLQTEDGGQVQKFFHTKWLFAECYVYRRLKQCFSLSRELSDFDFFDGQKREAFYGSLNAAVSLLTNLEGWLNNSNHPDKDVLLGLVQISLWGNKCDLSISAGSSVNFHSNPLDQVAELKPKLLLDESPQVVEFLLNTQHDDNNDTIDIVMDNAGFELMSDLCLSDYLVSTNVAKKMRLRVKNQPWFVSDTMPKDIKWLLGEMSNGAPNKMGQNEDNVEPILKKFGQRWQGFLDQGVWSIHSDPFWTWPHDYSLMKKDDPKLYQDLGQAKLVIFKGDLNYRKLVGDLNWAPTDLFSEALQGFHPAPLVTLRTLKADVVTGLKEGQAEETTKKDPKWMVNGEWGVIQFCSKVQPVS